MNKHHIKVSIAQPQLLVLKKIKSFTKSHPSSLIENDVTRTSDSLVTYKNNFNCECI